MRNLLQFALLLVMLTLSMAGTAWAQRAPQAEGRSTVAVSAASPNPFQVASRFSVTVDKAQEVTVEVYNLLGQKVQELYRGAMLAGESRVFAIEARGLPAGLYVYRVETEQGVTSRQVTLLR